MISFNSNRFFTVVVVCLMLSKQQHPVISQVRPRLTFSFSSSSHVRFSRYMYIVEIDFQSKQKKNGKKLPKNLTISEKMLFSLYLNIVVWMNFFHKIPKKSHARSNKFSWIFLVSKLSLFLSLIPKNFIHFIALSWSLKLVEVESFTLYRVVPTLQRHFS